LLEIYDKSLSFSTTIRLSILSDSEDNYYSSSLVFLGFIVITSG